MERCAMQARPEELAERATDSVDLRAIYERYAGPLYWYALSLLERAEEAEDVVHEVFAALLHRGGKTIDCPHAYLFTSARRLALEVRHRRGREDPIGDAERASWVETGAEQDLAIDVDRALKALPVEQREVVALKVLEGLTFREIAKVLRIPANTAASRYRLALARLRTALKDGKDDGSAIR